MSPDLNAEVSGVAGVDFLCPGFCRLSALLRVLKPFKGTVRTPTGVPAVGKIFKIEHLGLGVTTAPLRAQPILRVSGSKKSRKPLTTSLIDCCSSF